MKVGHVPLIDYHRPGDPKVGDLVAEKIKAMADKKTPIRAVMLSRLGPNVWHETLAQASAVLEELEETARLWLMHKSAPLTEEQIQALRDNFGASW
jgi:ribulose-5-phosphate 4-epimerase/fuculose-1-phosphate aldolase